MEVLKAVITSAAECNKAAIASAGECSKAETNALEDRWAEVLAAVDHL